jgi:transcriptional regulator with XRE-family HTH domain
MTSARGSNGKAVDSIRAFAADLAGKVPGFAEGAEIEREADHFCRSVREALGEHREVQNLNQAALGQAMGLSQPAVSRIERGDGDIGLKTIYRYARALGLKPHLSFAPSVALAAQGASADPVLAAVVAEVGQVQDELLEAFHRSLVEHQVRMQEVLAQHVGAEEEAIAAGA